MPREIAGPAPLNDPPLAATLLTVSKSRLASKSQTISPVFVEYARSLPPNDSENAMPGIADTAAACAGLPAPAGGGVFHSFAPVSMRNAYNPGVPSGRLISATAA